VPETVRLGEETRVSVVGEIMVRGLELLSLSDTGWGETEVVGTRVGSVTRG